MIILPAIINLNIAEKLLEGPKSIEELTRSTLLNPENLHRFLQQLESSEIFSFDRESRKWSNSPQSVLLTDPNVKPWVKILLSQVLSEAQNYSKLLYSDKDIFEMQGLPSFFEQISKVPQLLAEFQEGMRSITMANICSVVEAINLDSSNCILDVGGGDGSLMVFLAEKYPDVRGGVFERPEVAAIARKIFEDKGISDRIRAFEGDFLVELPKGFDSILMKHVTHNWPDEMCLKILKNCRDALKVGNKLFVVDIVLGACREYYAHHTLIDMIMLGYVNAKERSIQEFELLMSQSGFRIHRMHVAEFESVIEAIAV